MRVGQMNNTCSVMLGRDNVAEWSDGLTLLERTDLTQDI